jgi:hypothetical protein
LKKQELSHLPTECRERDTWRYVDEMNRVARGSDINNAVIALRLFLRWNSLKGLGCGNSRGLPLWDHTTTGISTSPPTTQPFRDVLCFR